MIQPSQPELPDDLEALRAALDQCAPPVAEPAANPVQPIHPNPKFEQLLHPPQPINPAPALLDQLLEDLEAIDTETEQAAKQQQEAERQATRQRQQQAARIRQAEQWLQQLDQKTDEAAWFEAFAANYSSRIEAAIDYLG